MSKYKCNDCNHIFSSEEEVFNTPEMNFWWGPTDLGKQEEGDFPSDSWLPSGQAEMDQQDPSNIMAFSKKELNKKAFCKKEANPPSRFWIAPDGREFPIHTIHPVWMRSKEGQQVLRSYGIDNRTQIFDLWDLMYRKGWVRVSNEPAGKGFQLQVYDTSRIPSTVDDFIAKYFNPGDIILIGDGYDKGFEITDPFPTIQKAVDKIRRPVNSSLKQAAISGQIVRDILEIVESSGGITYNLQKGNLSGTPNYVVATHPERTNVINGVIEFDDIQHYLDTNEDLLSDPNNSLGIWTHEGKIYYDIVQITPDLEEAKELGRKFNQIAIWDLANSKEIPTGGTGEVKKVAEESPLTNEQEDEISSVTCPAYVIALNNYYEAAKRGHSSDRSLAYAIDSVKSIEKIDEKKLVELINLYLKGLVR